LWENALRFAAWRDLADFLASAIMEQIICIFEESVLLDLVGSGSSELAAYDPL
jgi:hypothetical protein